jgi:hypothetical protein
MRSRIAIVAAAWSMILLQPLAAFAQGIGQQVTLYTLHDPSNFAVGCFGPCDCPIVSVELRGSFELVPAEVDPLFSHYDVVNVKWRTPSGTSERRITGKGTYRVGGEFAAQHEMKLELSIDGGPPRRFESGLVLGGGEFPLVDIELAQHGFACWDTVIAVRAGPVVSDAETTGRGRFEISAVRPNPFRDDVRVGLELQASGIVTLRVFDASGRVVSTPASRHALAAGTHWLEWDGRTSDGREAPAGLYFVRLESGASVRTRAAVKIR